MNVNKQGGIKKKKSSMHVWKQIKMADISKVIPEAYVLLSVIAQIFLKF